MYGEIYISVKPVWSSAVLVDLEQPVRFSPRTATSVLGRKTHTWRLHASHSQRGHVSYAPVRVSYPELSVQDKSLSHAIEAAYGPAGLGLLLVDQVPGLIEARSRLLPLAQQLASLPPDQLQLLEDPASSYGFGWSHGKESYAPGVADFMKASFYANPIVDTPTLDARLVQRYPSYCRPNLWPREALPPLEPAFKRLGRLIVQVGALVARECDAYVTAQTGGGESPVRAGRLQNSGRLHGIVTRSLAHKARLLHYFPPSPSQSDTAAAWCGWHNDHGSLTGLTSAMFTSSDGLPVPNPCPEAGLYVRTRDGNEVKVSIPEDCLAFQIGECAQVHSGGLLMATPHCVRAPSSAEGDMKMVGRNTFAVFMQPTWDETMDPPSTRTAPEVVGVKGWNSSMNFGEFTEERVSRYYN